MNLRSSIVACCLLAASALAATSHSQEQEPREQLRFAWSQPGVAAAMTLPLPPGVAARDIESVSLPGPDLLAGYALDGSAASLRLQLLPDVAGESSFSSVDLRLVSGLERRFEFGRATVLSLAGESGPLQFQRALTAPAGGLYLAVALVNAGDRELLLCASEYLPKGLAEGELLVAKGEPAVLLPRLEAAMTPSAQRQALPEGAPYPRVAGFRWLPASDLDLSLAPREAAVLAWTHRALPADVGGASFELLPVIEYRLADESSEQRWNLGLPLPLRGDER